MALETEVLKWKTSMTRAVIVLKKQNLYYLI